jgi:hypothetical protein
MAATAIVRMIYSRSDQSNQTTTFGLIWIDTRLIKKNDAIKEAIEEIISQDEENPLILE